MAIDFRTPEQIAEEYLLELKALKPEVNTKQTDSDWWIRSRVVGAVVSGVYADQRLIANDAFPQRARHDALGRHLELWFADTFKSATPAVGFAAVTGTAGSVIPPGLQFTYQPNGNIYQSTSGFAMPASTALVPVQSINTGQAQNLISDAPLLINSPPAGVNSAALAFGNFTDGRDTETDAQAAARILLRVQNPPRGGTAADYKLWALSADDSVVDANVIRFPFGFGTLAVVITAGTTDVDFAIDNGFPVVQEPSQALIDKVQAYIDARKPETACVTVIGPTPVAIDVTVFVSYLTGNNNSIPGGQTLTQEQLVKREVMRALYKTPPGGRQIGASGFVLASEIEEVIDLKLSASPFSTGDIPILSDRQVLPLSFPGPNYPLLGTQIPVPGTITVQTF